MAGPEKRMPGQSNGEYTFRPDPNAAFLGEQSLSNHSVTGTGSTTTFVSLLRRWLDWRKRKRTGGQ